MVKGKAKSGETSVISIRTSASETVIGWGSSRAVLLEKLIRREFKMRRQKNHTERLLLAAGGS